MARIDDLLSELTLDEKVSLVTGKDLWTLNSVERLGIPSVKVTDGPNGARGDGLLGTGLRSYCAPCGSALGATWNPELVQEIGAAIGSQARTKSCVVLLAPTINIHRSPLGGRNFECYSEDPHLSGRVAVGFVRGVQSQGVATTPKHFVANDAEFERNTINSVVPERALREIYLRPFEMAVKDGEAWGIMSAYNRLNGTFMSEHQRALDGILKSEWGFDGFVVTDWFAARSTVASANAGLDLEMPGPGAFFGNRLVGAVRDGDVEESVVDDKVRRLLRLMERTGVLDDPPDEVERELDDPAHRALGRRAAAEATVLLSNDGLLPLDVSSLSSIALIGPNAGKAMLMGGGSAALRAFHETSPLEAVQQRWGHEVRVEYAKGADTERSTPVLAGGATARPSDGRPGFDLELFSSTDWSDGGRDVGVRTFPDGRVLFFGDIEQVEDSEHFTLRATTTFTPPHTGRHQFTLVQAGRARLSVDGTVVCDGIADPPAAGDSFFGMGSEEMVAEVAVESGRPVEIVVEYSSEASAILRGFVVGSRTPATIDLLAEAVGVAGRCDVAVVVVGTNDDWETEGRDRDSMELPPGTDELVSAVASVNDATIVVINAGSPVATPWVDEVSAVLDTWFGGQEMADGLLDVLAGEAEPSGRLPMSFPERVEHNPSFTNFPGENGEVHYGEGVFVGYRYYDAKHLPPRFPFGHGGSYTSFSRGTAEVTVAGDPGFGGGSVRITVPVTNTGDRPGVDVVQAYVAPESPRLARPPKELKAFAKVALAPGETTDVVLELDDRAFQYYDNADQGPQDLDDAGVVPSGGGADKRTTPGWYADPGVHRILLGASAADLWGSVEVTLGS